MPEKSVLFVCLGNICRSPAAEGIFRSCLAERGLAGVVKVDSAGTIDQHAGERADPRMRDAASARGYELGSRARRVRPEDFERFDLIVAMDRSNRDDLERLAERANGDAFGKLRLLSEFLPAGSPTDVPDPYWGGPRGFDDVLDLLEEACPVILDELVGEE
ncbi:MAG TPA: low molecular weight protein-tyrosine-phosphatase [Thermoanaerobaculia bacterium]